MHEIHWRGGLCLSSEADLSFFNILFRPLIRNILRKKEVVWVVEMGRQRENLVFCLTWSEWH